MPVTLRLRPWASRDLDLLRALDSPDMKVHLGGPEGEEATQARHGRFLLTEPGQHVLVVEADGVAAGNVMCWDTTWHEEPIKEAGWSILPAFQGHGFATWAVRRLGEVTRADGTAAMFAFPNVANGPSNRVCARVGFELLGSEDIEYPKGSSMRVNDWRLDLTDL